MLETLDKAIKIAKRNGWDGYGVPPFFTWYNIIFDHYFAKCFFGEKDMWHETKCTCEEPIDFHIAGYDAHDDKCARPKAQRGYLFHLQKMVIMENPIDYLRMYLDGKTCK